MGALSRISPERFWSAFQQAWSADPALRLRANALFESCPKQLDELMRGSGPNPGLLGNVLLSLAPEPGCLYVRELYKLDAALVCGEAYSGADPERAPARFHAIVEHEVRTSSHKEIWKLAQWRAPLKVLVTYDWDESPARENGLSARLTTEFDTFAVLIANSYAHWPESPDTGYLLLAANRVPDLVLRWSGIALDPCTGDMRQLAPLRPSPLSE